MRWGWAVFLSALVLSSPSWGFCGAFIHALNRSGDWVSDRDRLETTLATTGIEPAERYSDVRPLLLYFDIRETPTFLRLPEGERTAAVVRVAQRLAKLPAPVRELNRRAGFGLSLTIDNVVEHPRMHRLWNVRPRGHARGTTWEKIPGVGASQESAGAVVAARHLEPGAGHGAVDLVLHEVAHNFDWAWGRFHPFPRPYTLFDHYAEWRWGHRLSNTPRWRELHRKYRWPHRYQQKYSEEAFAEAVARYFLSPETQQSLRDEAPEAFDFIEQEVVKYAGPPALFLPGLR